MLLWESLGRRIGRILEPLFQEQLQWFRDGGDGNTTAVLVSREEARFAWEEVSLKYFVYSYFLFPLVLRLKFPDNQTWNSEAPLRIRFLKMEAVCRRFQKLIVWRIKQIEIDQWVVFEQCKGISWSSSSSQNQSSRAFSPSRFIWNTVCSQSPQE